MGEALISRRGGSSGGVDVSDTTATASRVLAGYTFYNKSGAKEEGTLGLYSRELYGWELEQTKTFTLGFTPRRAYLYTTLWEPSIATGADSHCYYIQTMFKDSVGEGLSNLTYGSAWEWGKDETYPDRIDNFGCSDDSTDGFHFILSANAVQIVLDDGYKFFPDNLYYIAILY